jgi:hypothetical protein
MKAIGTAFAVVMLAGAVMAPDVAAIVGDGSDCGGFTVADAAAWLKAPVEKVARDVSKAGGKWVCSYSVGKAPPAIAFSVDVAASPRRAAADLERYRDELSAMAEEAAWKGKLPQGVYSDIFGAGDEGVWTDINHTYAVRRDAVIVRFSLPKEKDGQIELGKVVIGKF